MSDDSAWIEIVLLAMLAAFIGLRLVSVLGKRTGQERPIGDNFRPAAEVQSPQRREADRPPRGRLVLPAGTDPALLPALEDIAGADAGFAPAKFLDGARSAYGMILGAFWAGNLEPLHGLAADDVQDNLAAAIEARGGHKLGNRLVAIDDATISAADMIGNMIELTVRFTARVAAPDGETTSHDLWTFSRLAGNADPAWVLIATDNEADSGDMLPDHTD
ncbi:Tim44/TimA family putative adaptor protein [Sandarakinorhabdus sp.]|uniref:Tim44/TimA family putative adaptor protein n=1 Tax=Sandarakinorhabdus sp. TaxID=1916663 RepID=UPI00333E5A06